MIMPKLLYYDTALGVTAFSSTRHGGYSKGNYGEFNINPYCGDEQDAIKNNFTALCRELSINENCFVLPHQVHKTEILIIDKDFMQLDCWQRKKRLEGIDALITKEQDICIAVSTADCVPILLYSSEYRIAAAVHAGWRGTLNNIAGKTVATMTGKLGADPNKISAIIGPSISQEAFEVGAEVYEQFENKAFDMHEIATHINGKWHIDLWKANAMQLEAPGIRHENIHKANICTFSNCCDYFSARRLGINSGRIVSGIILRQP